MFGKSVVAAVVCRHCHDGACSVSCQYIIANPDGYCFARKRIDGVASREYACYAAVGDTFAFGTFLGTFQISVYIVFLFRGGYLGYQFAFGSQHHKGNSKHGICTGGENGKFQITVFYLELDFGAFAAAYPILLCFFQGFGPVDGIQSVQQALRIGGHAETPLTHLFLNYGETAAFGYAVYHFVIGKHGTELRTPVYHCLTQIGDTVIHQDFLLFFFAHGVPFVGSEAQFFAACGVQSFVSIFGECFCQFFNGTRLLFFVAVIAVEHLLESPLCPMIVFRIASTYFTVPVERETYFVQLLAIAVDIVDGSDCGMLPRLYGVLLCGQAVSVISHGIQDIETLQTFVTGINVRSDVSQRMSHMQTCAAGVGEHVQYIIFLLCFVFRHLVGFIFYPSFLPFLFNLSEIVFHNGFYYIIVENLLIYLLKLVDSLLNSVYILLIKRCKVKSLFSDL